MITKLDDYLIHQLPTTIDHVVDSDPRWYDRYWFNIHEISGEVVIGHGMGVYPNMNVMDGFGGVVYQGRQHNVRVSRELRHERADTAVGPLQIEVIEGLKKIRIALGENPYGISYDLTFVAATPPYERPPTVPTREMGRLQAHMWHYNQSGRVSGWVKVAGKTFEAKPETWWAVRDHSWGIRVASFGGPEMAAPEPPPPRRQADGLAPWRATGLFMPVQFKNRYLFMLVDTGEIIYPEGDSRGRVRITRAETKMEFHPGTIKPKAARSTITDEKGNTFELTCRPLSTFYLTGGGYGGHKGYYMGRHQGAYHIEGDVWDVGDPRTLREVAGRDDHVSEFRTDGETGYGVFEVGVRGQQPYAPYGPAA